MIKFIELNNDKSPKYGFQTTYKTMKELENAGLQLNPKVVLVDWDGDNVNEEIIIDYIKKEYPTLTVKTTKGTHFYYAKPDNVKIGCYTDTITVGGFQVDYKTGTKAYAVVKLNGIERETNQPLSFDNLPELPPILYPLKVSKENLSGMAEGDGRNDKMFNHLCWVQRIYPDIDLEDMAQIINERLFLERLEIKELESIIKSVKSYYDPNEYTGDLTDMIAFAQWIIPKLDIKIYNGQLYFRDDKTYITDNRLLLRKITHYTKLKRVQDNELIHQLLKFAEEIDITTMNLPVYIRNGRLIDGEYNVNDMQTFSPFYLDVEYNANAYDEHVDKFLNDITCNRIELRQTLEEILGHILLTSKFPAHVFFLSGGGNNGKSTFLEMINNFVGKAGQNLSLDAFNDDTSIATLNSKLSNCADETDDIKIDKCKRFKSLASGNTITVRPIYQQPIKIRNVATLILSANKMPIFKDKTEGFFRRLMIIPFDFVITEKIENLDELLSTDNAKSYILNLALGGVKRIKANNYKMTKNKYVDAKIDEYITDNDPIAAFIKSNPNIDGEMTCIIYNQFDEFCKKSEFDIGNMSLSQFSSKMKEYGYKSTPAKINKQSVRVYKKMR